MSDKERSGDKEKKSPDERQVEIRYVPIEYMPEMREEDDEIDLIELAKQIWDGRYTIVKFVAVGIILGVAVALLSPKEYQSGATLMPEMQSSESGASSLLQQYGGLLGMSSSADLGREGMIPPQLYPQIVQSLPFQLELLNQEVRFERFDTTTTVYNFFSEVNTPSVFSYITEYTIGLLGKIIDLFSEEELENELPRGFESDSIVSVSKAQMEVINNLRERVNVSLDEETGVINLSAKLPDPNAAAQVTRSSIELIKEYVTQYRTQKAQEDLQFSQKQLESAEERFRAAQDQLAAFRDANINLSSARAQTQQQRLQSEYDLTFNVYNSMAQQVEQAKLRLQEQTPTFSVIQPVQIPVDDETSGGMILIVFILLSGAVSVSWIFISQFFKSKQIN